jgi:hypothetical protein
MRTAGDTQSDRRSAAVGEPPSGGAQRITGTDQTAPDDNHSLALDRRVTALVTHPILANKPLNLRGKQKRNKLKDLA